MSNTQWEDAVKRGSNMRDKAMAIAMKRKEEYLGARVPKALKERVIKKADEMNIPVSLLMRRLLEQSFPEDGSGSANDDLNNVGSIAEYAGGQADNNAALGVKFGVKTESQEISQGLSQKVAKYAGIIGWKQIEVNQDRSCERCKEPLPRGTEASLGFTSTDAGYVIVCQQCKTQLIQSE